MANSRPTYLTDDATPERLQSAFAANTREWALRHARHGGDIRRYDGATWCYPPGPGGDNEVLFPRLTAATASRAIDAMVADFRSRTPLKSVLYWSLWPPRPRDLGARLLARGFQWCWQPHWMWLELAKLQSDHRRPPDLRIESLEDEAVWDVNDVPYYSRDDGPTRAALARTRPRRVWEFGAWLGDRPVGHSAVNVTTGPLGVAGIFSVGVAENARNQGIGKALVIAACEQARKLGCRHALLNATGPRMYQQVGFTSIGWGQTWFMPKEVLAAPPPTPDQVVITEAVGRGDLATLESHARRLDREDLDAPLPNGSTLLQVAVDTKQPAAAEWLVAHGASLDLLAAWDLGWKERLPQLLGANPELVNRRSGDWQTTPLHEAAQRNDVELARILLAANPDLEAKDSAFNSTPLGWARHLKRAEIAAMIEGQLSRGREATT
jgi:predicted N-acetyltransferase YhbS